MIFFSILQIEMSMSISFNQLSLTEGCVGDRNNGLGEFGALTQEKVLMIYGNIHYTSYGEWYEFYFIFFQSFYGINSITVTVVIVLDICGYVSGHFGRVVTIQQHV